MNSITVPMPRPPTRRVAAPAATTVTTLDVTARPVDLEPGLWVWSAFDGDRLHVAHGYGDGTQVADWVRESFPGPLLLRGVSACKVAHLVPDAAFDDVVVDSHAHDVALREREQSVVSAMPRLQVATDGSASNGCIGSAWVAADGRRGASGRARRGHRRANAFRAEFEAVSAAVLAMHPNRRLELLVDATGVIDDLRRAVAGEPVRFGSKLTGRAVAALAGRDVKVTWVQGHSGHVMNEAADRLAVHARRRSEVQEGPCPEVMDTIVESLYETDEAQPRSA